MKKTVLKLITISCLWYSCQKVTNEQKELREHGIEFNKEGNYLIFQSASDYENLADCEMDEHRQDVLKSIREVEGFKSLGDIDNSIAKSDRDYISSDFLLTILNSDAIVKIGHYFYKIDKANERVLVMHETFENEMTDLIDKNLANSHIWKLSTSANVIDEMEGMSTVEPPLDGEEERCLESGIGERHVSIPLSDNLSKLAYADFNKWGIYFDLRATISPQGSWPSPYVFEFLGGIPSQQGYIYYHARCGTTASYSTSTSGTWQASSQKFQSYQGSKNLNKVYFYYRVRNASTNQYVTPFFGFRVNI